MTFAKIFDTAYGQVVVLRQGDENNDPEVRFFAEPEGLGVCSMAIGFEEDAWEDADTAFNSVDLKMAESAAKELNKFSGI